MLISIFVAIFTTLFRLGSKSFSIDEIFSIKFSGSPNFISTLWFREFNMWLYYLILHFWLLFFNGEFYIRLLSALFAVAAVPFIYKTSELLFDSKVAGLTALLTSLNVFFVLYAQDARGYSLALLLSSASTFFYTRLVLKKTKSTSLNSVFYFLTSVLAIYAHVFCLLVILAQGVSLLFLPLKKYLKTIIVGMLFIVLAIIPLFISPLFIVIRYTGYLLRQLPA